MHLNQIHSFLAVSKTLNFTGAARQLGVPQSTISRQINDLETQLGVRLFYRTKRDVQLTDEGRIFLPYAQEMADAARKGAFAVKQLHEGAAGRLSIAAVPACRRVLTGILAAFHRSYPDITVDLSPLSPGTGLMDETESPYDFWFLYRDMLLDPDNFDYLPTHQEPLYIARRAEGPGTGKAPIKNPAGPLPDQKDLFDTLSSARFILLSEETDPILYMQTMNYCRTHRFTPRVANTFGDISSVLLSVSAGLGVTILPQSLLPAAPAKAGSLQPDHPTKADAPQPKGPTEADSPRSDLPTKDVSAAGPDRSPGLDLLPLDDESYALDCVAAWKPSLLNPAASLFVEVLKGTV